MAAQNPNPNHGMEEEKINSPVLVVGVAATRPSSLAFAVVLPWPSPRRSPSPSVEWMGNWADGELGAEWMGWRGVDGELDGAGIQEECPKRLCLFLFWCGILVFFPFSLFV
jgi:hypothetical protein